MTSRLTIRLLLFVVASGLLASCATDDPYDQRQHSAIPWNRPEKWESEGGIGGMMSSH